LSFLDCHWNQLTSLNVFNNTVLITLACSHNQLTELDLSNNSSLSQLYCDYNNFPSIDAITLNSALTWDSTDFYYEPQNLPPTDPNLPIYVSSVQWNQNTGIITIYTSGSEGRVIQLQVGSDQMIVNGISSTMTAADGSGRPVKAQISNGEVYVPVRALGNAFGVTIGWDAVAQTMIFNPEAQTGKGLSSRVEVTVGSLVMKVNGTAYPLSVPAYIDPDSDSLMVPVRLIALAFMDKSVDPTPPSSSGGGSDTGGTQEPSALVNVLPKVPVVDLRDNNSINSALDGVTDKASAIAWVDAAIDYNFKSSDDKADPDLIDTLSLYTEGAVMNAATVNVMGGNINLSNSSISKAVKTANETRDAAVRAIENSGVMLNREIKSAIKVKTATTGILTVKVNSSLLNSKIDDIRVESANAGVTVDRNLLAESDDGLIITVEPLYPKALSVALAPALAADTYKVTFSKPISTNVTISLPTPKGDPDYQSVLSDDGTNMGGKYNPATNSYEFKTNTSGVYGMRGKKKDFSDIQNKSLEMREAISVLATKGIISGTSETRFSPDASISRAEIAALVVRTLSKLDNNADGKFTDVTKSDWFFGAAGSSKKHGVISGYEDNTFRGNLVISKDQIVVIAARALVKEMKYEPVAERTPRFISVFTDQGDIPDWAKADIALAMRENLFIYKEVRRNLYA
jgi:hypothetical protein